MIVSGRGDCPRAVGVSVPDRRVGRLGCKLLPEVYSP
jgi:hypothetical protein